MWGVEHTFMVIGVALAAFLCRKDSGALIAIGWSQLPFWVGSVAYFVTDLNQPFINLWLDFICAAGFAIALHIYARAWLAWVAMVFISATILNLTALSPISVNYYFQLHEVIHYTALGIISRWSQVDAITRGIAGWCRGVLAGVVDR